MGLQKVFDLPSWIHNLDSPSTFARRYLQYPYRKPTEDSRASFCLRVKTVWVHSSPFFLQINEVNPPNSSCYEDIEKWRETFRFKLEICRFL